MKMLKPKMCSLLSLKENNSIFNILIVKFVFELYSFLLDILFDIDFPQFTHVSSAFKKLPHNNEVCIFQLLIVCKT